jgi:ketosteroid isomerase-like protein
MRPRQRELRGFVAISLVSFFALQGTCLVFAAANQATTEARKAIQAAYNRRNAAMAKKDLKTVWSSMAKNYVSISKDGTRLSGAQLRAMMTPFLMGVKSAKGTSTIRRITLQGNAATVEVAENGTVVGVHPQSKQEVVTRTKSRSLDKWVKVNGRWFIVQNKILWESMTVN